MPATNLLAMPLVTMTIAVSTNEDWVDSVKWVVDDGSPNASKPQLDLRGIAFEMEVRRAPPDHGVVLTASTDDGGLMIGVPPNFGFLIINIDVENMKVQQPGVYVADIVGKDIETHRVVATIALTINQGITR
jgi:hypothetical protein